MREPRERRASERHTAHVLAEFEVDGRRMDCGISVDASATGLLLLTRTKLTVGQELPLRILVPGERAARCLVGRVARCERLPFNQRDLWHYRVAIAMMNPPADLGSVVARLSKDLPR